MQLKVRCGDSFRSTKGSPDRTVMKVCKNNILTISKRVSNVLASLYKNITDATGKKKFLISLLLFHFLETLEEVFDCGLKTVGRN